MALRIYFVCELVYNGGTMQKRPKWLQVRMTQTELDKLHDTARYYGLDTSKFVRQLARYAAEFQPHIMLASDADAELETK